MTENLNGDGVCSVCHSEIDTITNGERHLPTGSILRGKYLIGKVQGEGGFGVTYIGLDLDLQIRVAIKEFYPRDFVSREMKEHLTLLPYDKESETFFESEKEKFIEEARRLARFREEEGVVSVLDYFKENGTAYIVMEYIEGLTLKKYLKLLNVRIGIQEVLHLLKPVMEVLEKMHKENMIHRDISPDNIMIRRERKKVYLIDFGSARNVSGEHSLSVYKKGSYTPLEQQSRDGKQGAWTDVYSLCATIYYCITGRNIPEAVERAMEDMLIPPSKLGVEIPEHIERAILNGLVLNPMKRTQSVEMLIQELYVDSTEHKSKQEMETEASICEKQEEVRNEDEKEEIEEGVMTSKENSVTEVEAIQSKKKRTWKICLGILMVTILFLFGARDLIFSPRIQTSYNASGNEIILYSYPMEEWTTKYYTYESGEGEKCILQCYDESGNIVAIFTGANGVIQDTTTIYQVDKFYSVSDRAWKRYTGLFEMHAALFL